MLVGWDAILGRYRMWNCVAGFPDAEECSRGSPREGGSCTSSRAKAWEEGKPSRLVGPASRFSSCRFPDHLCIRFSLPINRKHPARRRKSQSERGHEAV